MAAITNSNKTTRQIQAVVAAFIMTVLLAIAMLALGLNALINKNVVQVKNSPAAVQAAATTSQTAAVDPAQLQQLQNLITQYQSRETQYQAELKQAAQQLDQANAQIQQDQSQLQQYQSLLSALANAGVIQITSDGRILIPRSGGFRGDD